MLYFKYAFGITIRYLYLCKRDIAPCFWRCLVQLVLGKNTCLSTIDVIVPRSALFYYIAVVPKYHAVVLLQCTVLRPKDLSSSHIEC